MLAALQVVARPNDVHDDAFLERRAAARRSSTTRARSCRRTARTLRDELEAMARELGRQHDDARRIRRACYSLDNLPALGRQHATLIGLVEELLSQRVGDVRARCSRSNHDELTDPLRASGGRAARRSDSPTRASRGRTIWLERRRGAEIPLAGLLAQRRVHAACRSTRRRPTDAEPILVDDAPALGLPLALFKALQLLACASVRRRSATSPSIDIETTTNVVDRAEVVEIAAVRVRDRVIVDEFSSLVRPTRPIDAATREHVHGISDAEVANAPTLRRAVAARPRVLRRATCSWRTTATTSTSRSSSG